MVDTKSRVRGQSSEESSRRLVHHCFLLEQSLKHRQVWCFLCDIIRPWSGEMIGNLTVAISVAYET